MLRLIYDGEPAYHPATGLDLQPGEHEYPDDKAAALLAAGLRKPAVQRSSRAAVKTEEKE